MAVTAVLMDTAAARGSKLDPDMKAEVEFLSPDIESGQVGETELALHAVSRDKIKPGAVGGAQIGANEILAENMGPDSVGSSALIADAVLGEHAGPGVVTAVDAAGNYIESTDWIGTAAEYAMIPTPSPNVNYYVKAS